MAGAVIFPAANQLAGSSSTNTLALDDRIFPFAGFEAVRLHVLTR